MRDRVSGDARARQWVAGATHAVLAIDAALLGVVALSALGATGQHLDRHVAAVLVGCLAVLACVLLVAAGAALLLAAHRADDPRLSRCGWGVLVLAAICPLGVLARAVDPGHPTSVVAPLSRVVGVVLCALVVAAAFRSWSAPLRAAWEGAIALALLVVTVSSLSAVQLATGGALDGSPLVHALLETATAAIWIGVAVLLSRPAASAIAGRLGWRLAAGMALAHLLRAGEGGPLDLLTVAAGTVVVTVATFLLRGAWLGLLDLLEGERRRSDRARDDLVAVRLLVDDDAARMAGVAHDARNACLGVRAAVETLCRSEHRLDPAAAALLREAALSGMSRLEDVIAGDPDAVATVDVAQVAREVVASRRPLGAEVTVSGSGVLARAVPGDLGRILLNLLVNAQRHAAGSPVVVTVGAVGDTARVVVSDAGPGIAPEVAPRLFERGVHTAASPGLGLGLHLARSLARAHGGDLVLLPGGVGATFELVLPLAAPAVVAATDPHPTSSRDRVPTPVG